MANSMEINPDVFSYERAVWQQGLNYVAGVDEAGRGPLAGPVVAAAVIFLDDSGIDGVKDSKLMTPLQREKLYDEIIGEALCVGVGQASPVEIDRLNILQASLLAMRRAVEDLVITPEHVLIDGNQSVPHLCCPQQTIVKGDQHCFSISAASIIAKVTRDRMMIDYHQLYPHYGFDKHKGYPSKSHRRAIQEYGFCEIHRKSFKVTL